MICINQKVTKVSTVIRYWPRATLHLQASTCEYTNRMGKVLHDTASVCAHQKLCTTEFRVCTCTKSCKEFCLNISPWPSNHGHRWPFYRRVCHHQSHRRDLESWRNFGLIPAIPVYQIRTVMRFYGHKLKFTGIN